MECVLKPPLGIYGGTFSPIHNGHLRLAIELRETLAIERIHLVLSARPPHRAAPGVPARRRFEWLRLALQREPSLVADDRELRRSGRSYTYDTLRELRKEHPERPLLLILGNDALNALHTWHRWQALPELAHFVVVDRPGVALEPDSPWARAFGRGLADDIETLRQTPAGRWIKAHPPLLSISATRVRGLLSAQRSVRGLVPDAVIDSFTPEDIHWLTQDEEPVLD